MNKAEIIDRNQIHISTPRLMSIPPKDSEIRREKEFKEKLRKEGKYEFKVCCNNTRNFIQGAIDLGITKRELNILKESLHQHSLDRFGRNKYENKETREIDLDSLVHEVFEISTFFDSEEVSKYFLNEFYELVQKENTNPHWTITLERFNRKWQNKAESKNSNGEKFTYKMGLIENLKLCLENNQFKEIFEHLSQIDLRNLNEELYCSNVLLKGRLDSLQKEIIKGTISYESESMEKAKIRAAILILILELEKSIKNNPKPTTVSGLLDSIDFQKIILELKEIQFQLNHVREKLSWRTLPDFIQEHKQEVGEFKKQEIDLMSKQSKLHNKIKEMFGESALIIIDKFI